MTFVWRKNIKNSCILRYQRWYIANVIIRNRRRTLVGVRTGCSTFIKLVTKFFGQSLSSLLLFVFSERWNIKNATNMWLFLFCVFVWFFLNSYYLIAFKWVFNRIDTSNMFNRLRLKFFCRRREHLEYNTFSSLQIVFQW